MTISKEPVRYMDYQYVSIHQVLDDDGKVLYEGPQANCVLYLNGFEDEAETLTLKRR